jgi:hypothetical protein
MNHETPQNRFIKSDYIFLNMLMVRIGTILLIVSLALLIIYGFDVIVAMSKNGQDGTKSPKGFLPFNEATRGIAFGATAVVMSIVAFVITRKTPSRSVAILLIINGGIILAGMFFIMTHVALTANSARTVGSTIVMGLLLVALGIVKSLYDKRHMAQRKEYLR